MASMPNAASVPEDPPLVTVINVPAGLSSHNPSINVAMVARERHEFISNICSHIANNESVLIKNWYPEERYGFSVEEISMLFSFMLQEVDFQGMMF